MLVGHARNVAGCIDAGEGGAAIFVDLYFAARRRLQAVGKGGAVGHQTYLYENAIKVNGFLLAVGAVCNADRRDLFAIADDLLRLGREIDIDVGQLFELFLQYGVGLQRVEKLEYRYVSADAGQVDGRLDAGVAAAHYGHVFSFIERAVAMWAEMHPVTDVFGFVVDVKSSPIGARCDNNGRSEEFFSSSYFDTLLLAFQRKALISSVFEDVDAVSVHMFAQIGCQRFAGGACDGNEVLDSRRLLYLSADALRYDSHFQPLSSRIDGG